MKPRTPYWPHPCNTVVEGLGRVIQQGQMTNTKTVKKEVQRPVFSDLVK